MWATKPKYRNLLLFHDITIHVRDREIVIALFSGHIRLDFWPLRYNVVNWCLNSFGARFLTQP
jgi:hypothetical protein